MLEYSSSFYVICIENVVYFSNNRVYHLTAKIQYFVFVSAAGISPCRVRYLGIVFFLVILREHLSGWNSSASQPPTSPKIAGLLRVVQSFSAVRVYDGVICKLTEECFVYSAMSFDNVDQEEDR